MSRCSCGANDDRPGLQCDCETRQRVEDNMPITAPDTVAVGLDTPTRAGAVGKRWHERWMAQALVEASYSKDPSTKVGAVIVQGRQRISSGYNGFPMGADDSPALYLNRPLKYDRIVHAEQNAINFAARYGAPTKGATLYSTFPVCPHPCAGSIINAGISLVVVRKPRCEYCAAHDRTKGELTGRMSARRFHDGPGQLDSYELGRDILPGMYFHEFYRHGRERVRCALPNQDTWVARYVISKQMFQESGVQVVEL